MALLEKQHSKPLLGPTWMHANIGGKCDGGHNVDMILGRNHLDQILTIIDLGARKFNCFLNYTFYEILFNCECNLDWCQIRVSVNSWGLVRARGLDQITKGPLWG